VQEEGQAEEEEEEEGVMGETVGRVLGRTRATRRRAVRWALSRRVLGRTRSTRGRAARQALSRRRRLAQLTTSKLREMLWRRC
jgi:hypothetical protein